MKTLHPYPGKFEGNHSQMVARAAHSASLDGCNDEEAGDVSEYGWFACKVVGKRYVFIVVEDDQGFVDVEVFKAGDPAIETNWAVYANAEADTFYGDGPDEN